MIWQHTYIRYTIWLVSDITQNCHVMSLSATGWGWGKYLVNCEITKCGPSSPNHHQVRTQISINSQNNIEDVLGRNNWLTTWPTFVIVTEGKNYCTAFL